MTLVVIMGLSVISLLNLVMFARVLTPRRASEDQQELMLDPVKEKSVRRDRNAELVGSFLGFVFTQVSVIGAIYLIAS